MHLTPDPARPSRYQLRPQDWALIVFFCVAISAIFGALSILMQKEFDQSLVVGRVITVSGIIVGVLMSFCLYLVFSRDGYRHSYPRRLKG